MAAETEGSTEAHSEAVAASKVALEVEVAETMAGTEEEAKERSR
jgi:hypothetical protein